MIGKTRTLTPRQRLWLRYCSQRGSLRANPRAPPWVGSAPGGRAMRRAGIVRTEEVLAEMRAGAGIMLGGSRCHTNYFHRDGRWWIEDFDEGAVQERETSEAEIRALIAREPERARGMDACASAMREGVPFTIHSDAPVTPLGHLHTMWCAVNRRTATDQQLGEYERLSVDDALHAVTLGAAYQIKMDHDVGSLEVGKRADMAVLDDDPYEVDPMTLKDIGVWGTVLGGVPHQAGAGAD